MLYTVRFTSQGADRVLDINADQVNATPDGDLVMTAGRYVVLAIARGYWHSVESRMATPEEEPADSFDADSSET